MDNLEKAIARYTQEAFRMAQRNGQVGESKPAPRLPEEDYAPDNDLTFDEFLAESQQQPCGNETAAAAANDDEDTAADDGGVFEDDGEDVAADECGVFEDDDEDTAADECGVFEDDDETVTADDCGSFEDEFEAAIGHIADEIAEIADPGDSGESPRFEQFDERADFPQEPDEYPEDSGESGGEPEKSAPTTAAAKTSPFDADYEEFPEGTQPSFEDYISRKSRSWEQGNSRRRKS